MLYGNWAEIQETYDFQDARVIAKNVSISPEMRQAGRFVLAITKPCLQSPSASNEMNAARDVVTRRVVTHTSEGFWRSDRSEGVRGHQGAYHRTLATHMNELIEAGFAIATLVEPVQMTREGQRAQAPSVLVVAVTRGRDKAAA